MSVENSSVCSITTFDCVKLQEVEGATTEDPLAQSTRARLYALLERGRQPLTSEELAAELGLHVNGVRRHLERLEAAGLVDRAKVRGARGRPRDQWSIAARATPGGRRPEAYADLARWLTRVAAGGRGGLRRLERSGREIGRELVPTDQGGSGEDFQAVLAALGFQPDLQVDDQGTARCRLCNCPYRDAVVESPEVVCTLHRGITAGLVDVLAPEASLTLFEPHDPDRAGCELVVEGVTWPSSERSVSA